MDFVVQADLSLGVLIIFLKGGIIMMGLIAGKMFFSLVLMLFVGWGFSYIILLMANKENGLLKIIGKGLAAVIAIVVVIVFIYGLLFGQKISEKAKIFRDHSMMMMHKMDGMNNNPFMMNKMNMMGKKAACKMMGGKMKDKTKKTTLKK